VVLLVAGRLSLRGTSSRVAGVLSVVALLLAPGVWSVATAFAASGGGGAMAQAGPPGSGFGSGRGRLGPARADLETRESVPARFRGAMGGNLTAEQSAILAYAQANSAGHRITLAVEGGAMAADAYLIRSDAVIVGMGGFSGQDPAPTAATLAQWVQEGQLRFVLVSDRGQGAGSHSAHGGSGSPGSEGGVTALRTQWVQQHCAIVSPSAYGASDRIQVLYDCAG
jgi:hypothetical protein